MEYKQHEENEIKLRRVYTSKIDKKTVVTMGFSRNTTNGETIVIFSVVMEGLTNHCSLKDFRENFDLKKKEGEK